MIGPFSEEEVRHLSKIDIVIPCYNYGHFLESCVRSVLEQSVSDLRVLIIDDASLDRTYSVARQLSEADPRVSVISHAENWGHIRTYNQGIEWAEADYFMILSADDLLAPGAFERATSIMDKYPDIVLTHGIALVWQDDGPFPSISTQPTDSWKRQDLIGEMCAEGMNLVCTPTAILRTGVQKAVGGYRPSFPHAADMEMWLRCATKGTVATIDGVQAVYRKHTSNMSNAYFQGKLRDYRQRKEVFDSFFEECAGHLPNAKNLRVRANRALAEKVYWSGVAQLCRGDTANGRQLLCFSFDLNRRLRYSPPLFRIFRTPNLAKVLASIVEERCGRTRRP